MGVKNENEITMKIKGSLSDFYKYLKENKFKITEKFSMEDTFFIPVLQTSLSAELSAYRGNRSVPQLSPQRPRYPL